jgi:hypothetical protein
MGQTVWSQDPPPVPPGATVIRFGTSFGGLALASDGRTLSAARDGGAVILELGRWRAIPGAPHYVALYMLLPFTILLDLGTVPLQPFMFWVYRRMMT